ncbi:MAG TPA: molybdopterin dehydrogenase [Deltaproteobacteria bacterium]|jgi:carbon-monoxide dehydrogenase medium subunit|nr:molybdopterin dehydrogenase [Deltaproteobacteria bacterium]
MKPPVFDYLAPRSVAEAAELLRAHDGEAKVLAGGQSLMPLLAMRLARPSLLVDLGRIPELDYVREDGGVLAIGAMTTKTTIERSPLVRERQPLFHEATRLIGHPQIRNRGTVGGSMAQADPAAEYPAAAIALGATMRTARPEGERSIESANFFLSALTTALGPGEILTEVRIPFLPRGTGWSVLEFSRRHGDFAIAGTVVTLSIEAGRISSARIALFGVAATPLRVTSGEDALVGERPGQAAFETAAQKARMATEEPLSDLHASGEYRRHLAGALVGQALAEAAARARGTL